MGGKVVAIVGTYRTGGLTDTAVDEILRGAASLGARTVKVNLLDRHIEFCTNCRTCTQDRQVGQWGRCVHDDEMASILAEADGADGLVLASPVNVGTVTALMKRFIERLLAGCYWPWGAPAPKLRARSAQKRAITVTSSACPACLGRVLMRSPLRLMKAAARLMGAKVHGSLYFGRAGSSPEATLSDRQRAKAYRAGRRILGPVAR